MTIGVGIIADGGIVVAADTQESVQNYWKTNQGKVRWGTVRTSEPPSAGACIVTGAGSGRHLDAIQQQILDKFPKCVEAGDWESQVSTLVRQFHVDHIAPFPPSDYPNDGPAVSLIIATEQHVKVSGQTRYLHGLWATEKSIMARYHEFAAVGVGAGHATNLLNRLWLDRDMNLVGTAILAAFIVFHVKDYVDGCGNYTDLVAIKDADSVFLTRDQATKLEAVFRQMSRKTERIVANFLMSGSHGDINLVTAELQEIRAEFLKIVAEKQGDYDLFALGKQPE